MAFALVDCESFYASCERIFRPDLKNIPPNTKFKDYENNFEKYGNYKITYDKK